eukprot:TRINITY_DN12092_c0_g1_i1.p1 TRINITY_DN12092_c0_g1~~TRINITY_DN12092_c0_g1_i1.p1  ORF type:complete len:162 (+),score=54.72 TRINITY_DN12092_c0_g1_i1:175-660(+)
MNGFEGTGLGEFIASLEANMLQAAKRGPGPQGFIENCQAFCAAVDWSETWIQAILCFHAAVAAAALLSRNRLNCQISLFLTICALVRGAEWANAHAARRWSAFARQNYFDERGVFVGVVWCAPLLLVLLGMLLGFVVRSARLLVAVKRAQLRRELAARKQQ